MLTIRFTRVGKKNKAQFRIILQEKSQSPSSVAKEILGHYDPHRKDNFSLKKERIQYWISKGAQTSATVNNFFIKQGLIKGKKRRVVSAGKKKAEAEKTEGSEKTAENKENTPKKA